jgi:iron complex transport system ATP-binding protein
MQSPEPFFVCSGVSAAYDGAQVLHDVDLTVAPGEMVGVLGPNGSGKSTLLRVLSGVLMPVSGRVLVAGHEVHRMRARERAKLVGVVSQETSLTFAFSVWDMVAMGRHAHLSLLSGLTAQDRDVIRWALERTDCWHLRQRLITELSGGELQRVIIAQALAQEARALLLDEPTSQLDLNHQLEIGCLLRDLNRERGITIVWVSHDLNLAAEFCERIVMVGDGRVIADGPPEDVITEPLLEQLYGVAVPVIRNPVSGRPHVLLAACKEAAPC